MKSSERSGLGLKFANYSKIVIYSGFYESHANCIASYSMYTFQATALPYIKKNYI